MANFKDEKTRILEDRCLKYLTAQGRSVEKNNLGNLTDVDLKIDGKKVDFQYSCDYGHWGDLRIDTVSAYEHYVPYPETPILAGQALEEWLVQAFAVEKVGKVFHAGVEEIIYWIFNGPEKFLNARTDKPDLIYVANRQELLDYLRGTWRELVVGNRLKANKKEHLGDGWGSAFFAVPLKKLLEEGIGKVEK